MFKERSDGVDRIDPSGLPTKCLAKPVDVGLADLIVPMSFHPSSIEYVHVFAGRTGLVTGTSLPLATSFRQGVRRDPLSLLK